MYCSIPISLNCVLQCFSFADRGNVENNQDRAGQSVGGENQRPLLEPSALREGEQDNKDHRQDSNQGLRITAGPLANIYLTTRL